MPDSTDEQIAKIFDRVIISTDGQSLNTTMRKVKELVLKAEQTGREEGVRLFLKGNHASAGSMIAPDQDYYWLPVKEVLKFMELKGTNHD